MQLGKSVWTPLQFCNKLSNCQNRLLRTKGQHYSKTSLDFHFHSCSNAMYQKYFFYFNFYTFVHMNLVIYNNVWLLLCWSSNDVCCSRMNALVSLSMLCMQNQCQNRNLKHTILERCIQCLRINNLQNFGLYLYVGNTQRYKNIW